MSDSIEFNVSLNEPVNFNLEIGNQGPKGDKGDTGSKGDTGDRGEKGDPGTTDYNQLHNKPQLDLYLKKSEANTTTIDLLNKISQNTDSITDTKNSLRNYALASDVDGRISETKTELNEKISQAETRVNNAIEQAKTELNGKITEANNKTSALDTKFTKLTSDNKAEVNQIKANLATTNSVLSTHKELVDKRFTDVNTEQTSQNSLISDILNAFSKESEKGTNLKLNSSATKVLGMTIYGNTEQVNTSGKNLLKITARTAPSQGISSTVSDDGTVAYSGTVTGSWANITDYTVFSTPLPAGKYTFSIDHPRTHKIVLKYKLADNTFSEATANMTATSTSNTFTVIQPIIAGYLFIAAANGSNLNDTVKAQLEYGDTATDYEPYTDGLNNLFDDFSNLPYSRDGVTLSNQNGVLKLAGQPTADWVPLISRDITGNLINKMSYTIVQYNVNGVKWYPEVRAKRKDNGRSMAWSAVNTKVATFTVDFDTYSEYSMKLQMGLKTAYPEPITLYGNFALYYGTFNENNLPEYSPYNAGLASPRPLLPQSISKVNNAIVYTQSKNLFDTRFSNRTLNNVEIKTYEDRSFSLNGTVSIGSSLITPTYTKSFIPTGKYKLVVEHLGGTAEKNFTGANFIISIPIQKGSVVYSSYLRPEDLNGGTKIFDVNITDVLDEKYTPFVWIPHNEATNQGFWNYKKLRLRITLVKDGEDTEFTPFDTNTTSIMLPELNKIGNYQDCVYFKDGKWYLEKNTGTKTFDGSESWAKTSEDNVNIYYLTNSINSTSDYPDGFSTHFKNAKAYPNKASTFAIRGGGQSIFFNHETITTINDWKTWLNSNNVTAVFPTRPVITEINNPAILTQLNKLMEARTYDGLTNISVTGTDLTPEIKVKYMRKIN